jgi:hypothetical protein
MGPADPVNIFTGYTSLNEQASYTVRAFTLASSLGYVGPMFLYNLNGCQVFGDEGPSSCYYSLIGPRQSPRPVYTAVQQLLQGDEATPEAVAPTEILVVTPTPEG